MKKLGAILLALALLFLAGCTEAAPEVTVEKSGITFTVNRENTSISDGTHVYQYTHTGRSGSSYTITVYYPDGSSYYRSSSTSNGITHSNGGGSEDYDENRYHPGELLVDVVEQAANVRTGPDIEWSLVLLAVILVVIGAIDVAFPAFWWHLRYGLLVRDAEPTDFAISMGRIGAWACIVLGVIIGIVGFMGGIV